MTGVHTIGISRPASPPTARMVGNKAANLARLASLGLRVPPAIALETSVCREYVALGRLPADFAAQLGDGLRELERATGLGLGGRCPLVLSIRSSPAVSMPGMLETVLDVGLTEATVQGLIRRTGDHWLAWDAYRRLVRSFGTVVCAVPDEVFDSVEHQHLGQSSARELGELDPLAMRDVARAQASVLQARTPRGLPPDPTEQVLMAVEAVLRSWSAPRAAAYRRMNGIDDDAGTGVLIQAMVFGNAGPRSGSGVGFTRNPATGGDELYVDFAFNAQGEDIVAGRHVVVDSALLPGVLPGIHRELVEARALLEREFLDMQDFEFTVEDGLLYFLQTRDAKRTPWAALRVAVDLVHAGLLDTETAMTRLLAYDLSAIERKVARPGVGQRCLAHGVPASPGTVTGAISLARDLPGRANDPPAILVRHDLATDDIRALSAAGALLTAVGSRTSHAAVVARQLNRPCVVGCTDLVVDEAARTCVLGGTLLHDGDSVTLDGDSGAVYLGAVPVITERPDALLETVRRWEIVAAG